jgi:hypothetical protein
MLTMIQVSIIHAYYAEVTNPIRKYLVGFIKVLTLMIHSLLIALDWIVLFSQYMDKLDERNRKNHSSTT